MINKWKFKERIEIFKHPRMELVEDIVILPNDKEAKYLREKPTNNHSIAIIAINNENKILLQKEYSYPPNEVLWQFPGGAIEKGEDILAAANRELAEESGYVSEDQKIIGEFYVNNRRSDRKQYVVLCKNLKENKLKADDEEFIENYFLDKEEIKELIKSNEIKNVNALAAFCLLENL